MRRTAPRSSIALAVCLGLTACAVDAAPPEDAEPEVDSLGFSTGHGPLRGHEDITRFGISEANSWLAASDRFPTVPMGDSGSSSTNPVVQGNYASDNPEARMYGFYGVDDDVDWHDDPNLQNTHALRNFSGDTAEPARAACLGVRALITRTSARALAELEAGSTREFQFWSGHATHTIQDSFSEAHTTRSGNFQQLDDICVYNNSSPGACEHSFIDLRDRAWRETLACTFNPSNRSFDCLKPSAQSAARATAGYLYALTWAKMGMPLETAMNHFFDGFEGFPYSGGFRCDTL